MKIHQLFASLMGCGFKSWLRNDCFKFSTRENFLIYFFANQKLLSVPKLVQDGGKISKSCKLISMKWRNGKVNIFQTNLQTKLINFLVWKFSTDLEKKWAKSVQQARVSIFLSDFLQNPHFKVSYFWWGQIFISKTITKLEFLLKNFLQPFVLPIPWVF